MRLDFPGFFVPKNSDLRKRDTLDRYLSKDIDFPLMVGITSVQGLFAFTIFNQSY